MCFTLCRLIHEICILDRTGCLWLFHQHAVETPRQASSHKYKRQSLIT